MFLKLVMIYVPFKHPLVESYLRFVRPQELVGKGTPMFRVLSRHQQEFLSNCQVNSLSDEVGSAFDVRVSAYPASKIRCFECSG